MGREIEVKYRITQREAFETRLRELGAAFEGTVREQNTLYDDGSRSLMKRDHALRLRTTDALDDIARSKATITLKGPRLEGPFKEREEWESVLSDPEALRAIFAQLELKPVLHFAKERSTWRWEAAEIVIDAIDGLGLFLEIEAAPERIQATIAALGLDDRTSGAAIEQRSYPELLREQH